MAVSSTPASPCHSSTTASLCPPAHSSLVSRVWVSPTGSHHHCGHAFVPPGEQINQKGCEGHGMLSLIQGHPELEAKNIDLLAEGVEETLTFHL